MIENDIVCFECDDTTFPGSDNNSEVESVIFKYVIVKILNKCVNGGGGISGW